jgi:hypothetical protein
VDPDPVPHQIKSKDLDPHQSDKLDTVPDQSDKLDPDPHQKGKLDPDPHKVINWIRIWIRINLQMTSQNVWNMSLFSTFSGF